jgi:hypothetical protein
MTYPVYTESSCDPEADHPNTDQFTAEVTTTVPTIVG